MQCKTRWGSKTDKGILMHFGTANTYEALYRFNVEQLEVLLQHPEGAKMPFFKKLGYKYNWRYGILKIECRIKRVWKCGVKFLKKIFGKSNKKYIKN
jgi:hypothetical protein